MLHILTMTFFSAVAFAAFAMLMETLAGNMVAVRRALGAGGHAPALPRTPERIRPVRTAPRPEAKPALRAAA